MKAQQGQRWAQGISFREYLANVMNDGNRNEEFEVLIRLFGLPRLEAVSTGKGLIEPLDFIGAAREADGHESKH